MAKGGPRGPIEVTSWAQYQALFGSVTFGTNDMSYAVYNFFANAWPWCLHRPSLLFGRHLHNPHALRRYRNHRLRRGRPSRRASSGRETSDSASASRVFVTVQAGGVQPLRPRGRRWVQHLPRRDRDVDRSLHGSGGPRYAVDIVNSPSVGSRYVRLTRSVNIVGNAAPGVTTKTLLTGGTEGSAAVDIAAAAQLLGQVNKSLVINTPGADASSVSSIVTWAGEPVATSWWLTSPSLPAARPPRSPWPR